MQIRLKKYVRQFATCSLLAGAWISSGANADVTLNAGLGSTYESNVNGAPASTAQGSDTYTTLNASAVYYTPLDTAQTTYFIGQVGALTNKYNTYSNLDNTEAVASVGLYKQLSSNWSGELSGRGFDLHVQQNGLDATGAGTTLELKNQITSTVWLQGIADYEDSRADFSSFGYIGKTLGLSMGYLPLQHTFVSLGYNHITRNFDTTVAFNTITQAYFINAVQQLAKNWYLNGTYAYQDNNSNLAGTAYKDQILSLAINFSY
ncbi:MAG: hypothetical protein ACYCSS_06250 [Sulfuriferula sp.]